MGAQTEIMINAKPEQVFYVMTDPELSKQWLKGMVETIPLSETLDHPGARFKQRFKQGNKWSEYDGQVTAFQHAQLFAAEINNGPFLSCARYELAPSGTGTSLRLAMEFRGRTLPGKLISVPLGFMAKFMCRKQVTELKKFVESRKHELPL